MTALGHHSSAPDVELLRAFEPVARFTRGEFFYPVSVKRYVQQATLWDDSGGQPTVAAAAGTLDLARLGDVALAGRAGQLSISGLGDATGELRRQVLPRTERPPRLRGSSRLASVGLSARLVDLGNRLSLLFRGSVPGGSAAQSFILQRDHLQPDQPTYYGRVLREEQWMVCQYWYFYAFNNWRSGFGGVNEHEGDWEQVTVYLDGTRATGSDQLPQPRWVAFSAHDETGDDLRRRWDDPDLTVVGSHPVVFVGAGSHSGAYRAGDYLVTVQPPRLVGVAAVLRALGRVFVPWATTARGGFGLPYVDYARGDGRGIGPGEDDDWCRVVIDDETGWVVDFPGLWGHDTRDRLGGERGPAGPRYERDGSVRASWADPVGWAGLAKVAPNDAVERSLLQERIVRIDQELARVDNQVRDGAERLGVEAAGTPPGRSAGGDLAVQEQQLHELRQASVRLGDERRRVRRQLAGGLPPTGPHAHLSRRMTPIEAPRGARGRLLSWWAVLSTPLILWAVGAVVYPTLGVAAVATAIAWVVLLMIIEGIVRGQFVAVLLRLVAAAILAIALWWFVLDWRYVVSTVFFASAVMALGVNLREAWRR
ncbi:MULTISPECIES: hypothetical protein [unclassified Ornithinimicrobium]|uniref:hypothetical protein n=1 Tax=unclassified Ornithinimicrobium TaxID=2615080 RepID=UPI003854459D